jgi:hypothetical protein
MTARIFNVLMGGWLYLAAFLWPRSSREFVYTAGCGALTLLSALLSGYYERAAYVSLAVGTLLVVLTATLSWGSGALFWHNSIVGLAIVAASLFDRGTEGIRRERELYGRVGA